MQFTAREYLKLKTFMQCALSLSDLSCCKRLRVACIVIPVDMTNVLSIGYNGPCRGEPNDSCTDKVGACGCVHAEANAVVKLFSKEPAIMLCTTAPCESCAKLIINAGSIKQVLWHDWYRNQLGIELLNKHNIETLQI